MITVGQVIGSYRLQRQLGQGGMGLVFEAVHEQIGTRAAIKVLFKDLARDPAMLNRFFNEARAVNIIKHPSLVSIFECGKLPDGTAFIIMEYLEGETLTARLKQAEGRQRPELLPLCRQVASALAAAHAKGIVHRDLKPDNIMLVADPETPAGERVKILDFGIAKVASGAQQPQFRTQLGTIMGTPAYMSPEQCCGAEEATDRSDVYALGIILFEILTGRPPFQSDSMLRLIGMQLTVEPPPLHELAPEVPRAVSQLVLGMLAKAPGQRPSMAEVAARLGGEIASASLPPRSPDRGLGKVNDAEALAQTMAPTGNTPLPGLSIAQTVGIPNAPATATPAGPSRTGGRKVLIGGGSVAMLGVVAGLSLALRRHPALTPAPHKAGQPPADHAASAVPAPPEAVLRQQKPAEVQKLAPAPVPPQRATEAPPPAHATVPANHRPAGKEGPAGEHPERAGRGGAHGGGHSEPATSAKNKVKGDEDIPFLD